MNRLRIALYAMIKPYVNRKLSGREDIRTNGDIKAGYFFTLKGLVSEANNPSSPV
jgi:hypothetical protein